MIMFTLSLALVIIVYLNLEFFINFLLTLFVSYILLSVLFVLYWLVYGLFQELSLKEAFNTTKNVTNKIKSYFTRKKNEQ